MKSFTKSTLILWHTTALCFHKLCNVCTDLEIQDLQPDHLPVKHLLNAPLKSLRPLKSESIAALRNQYEDWLKKPNFHTELLWFSKIFTSILVIAIRPPLQKKGMILGQLGSSITIHGPTLTRVTYAGQKPSQKLSSNCTP